MSSTEFAAKRKNILERALSIFANVRHGEGTTAFLMTLNVFILLTAYYIIKPVREALILSGAGAEIKSYAGAGQAMLFLLIVPIYSAVASRVNRIRLINGVSAFFISNLAIFYILGQMQFQLGVVFFLWVGLFSLMVVAQFWAFANDIYTEEQGKRLFAIIGIGSSLGAIFGAQVAGWLFEPIGPFSMMAVAAGLLAVCMILTNWINYWCFALPGSRFARQGSATMRRSDAAQPIGTSGGFRLVLRHRYLLLIAILVLLSNFVNTTGEFILGKTVAQHAKGLPNGEAYIGEFYAGFFLWVNLLGAALQMFAVSRIMKYLGIGPALFILPVIALGSYTLLAFAPVLSYIRVAKIAENSADYSIQSTSRHALFLKTSREAKYKAQSAIESFFWRAGDALSALLVFIGTRLAFDISKFAITNTILVLVWLAVALAIVRLRKRERMAEAEIRRAA